MSVFVLRDRSVFLATSLFLFCSASIVGCGPSNPDTGNVTGVVTYNGSPLSGVSVNFTPDSGRPANGKTDASGRYVLSTFGVDDGAMIGSHRVHIAAASDTPPPMPGTEEAENAAEQKAPFPEKYASTSTTDLTAQVESGDNEINFDLTD